MRKFVGAIVGEVDILTFKEFLLRVPRQLENTVSPYSMEYTFATQVSVSKLGFTPNDVISDDYFSSYQYRIVKLMKGPEAGAAMGTLLPQTTLHMPFKYSLMSMIYDITLDFIEQFGNPKCLVKLGPRTWLIADPEDYRLVYTDGNDRAQALVCLASLRSNIYRVSRTTREQIEKGLNYV